MIKKAIREIEWFEGVFLRPQHFQYQQNQFKSQLAAVSESVHPYYYGVVSLAFNETALANGIISINKLHLHTADGSNIALGENAIIETRNIEEDFDEIGDSCTLYIGIRHIKDDYANSCSTDKEREIQRLESTRFIQKNNILPVYDILRDNSREEIRFLTYNLQIFLDTETLVANEFDLIPIAKLRKVGSRLVLDKNYVPPCLNVLSFPVLEKQFEEIASDLIRFVEDQDLDDVSLNKSVQETVSRSVSCSTVAALLATLDARRQLGFVSPYDAYRDIENATYSLSVFRKNARLSQLYNRSPEDRYVHEAPLASLRKAYLALQECLEEIVGGVDLELLLDFDGTYFHAELNKKDLDRCTSYFLEVRTTLPKEYVEEVVVENIKIGPKALLPKLVSRSLPGIKLNKVEELNKKIPVKADAVYLSLNIQNELWDEVRDHGNVAIYMDSVPSDIRFEILGIS